MTDAPDMKVKIGALEMRNPVTVASGTFGYGPEYSKLVDLEELGAIVVKGVSLEPWHGNQVPRMVEVPGGLVNAIGLHNPGVEGFEKKYMPFLREHDVPVIVNIWGKSIEEYAEVARRFDDIEGVSALEVNISCPNIKEGGIAFGTDPDMAKRVLSSVREATKLTLIPKLSPNVPDIKVFARIAEECGADGISLINTLPAMVIDTQTREPVLANITGGLSGPAIHPVAVKLVWEAAGAVNIPVIGMGGITSAHEAIEFILAGATAVAVGTANFDDPRTSLTVIDGIRDYLVEQGFASIQDAIGAVKV